MKHLRLTIILFVLNSLGLCQDEVQVVLLDDIARLLEFTRNLTADMQGLYAKLEENQETMMQEITNIKEELQQQANSQQDILLQRIQDTEDVLVEKITTVEGQMRKIKDQMIILNTASLNNEDTKEDTEEGKVEGCRSECPENAQCLKVEGSYECRCLPGYHGSGVTCEVPDCAYPSKVIQGLGCVVPLSSNKAPFDEMVQQCKSQGLRILQGITSAEQVGEIQRSFGELFVWDYWMMSAWIGIKNREWIDGVYAPIDFDSFPWSGYSDTDYTQCGNIFVPTETKDVSVSNCSLSMYGLCQQYE